MPRMFSPSPSHIYLLRTSKKENWAPWHCSFAGLQTFLAFSYFPSADILLYVCVVLNTTCAWISGIFIVLRNSSSLLSCLPGSGDKEGEHGRAHWCRAVLPQVGFSPQKAFWVLPVLSWGSSLCPERLGMAVAMMVGRVPRFNPGTARHERALRLFLLSSSLG